MVELKHFLGTQCLYTIVIYASAPAGILFVLTGHVFGIQFEILSFHMHWIFLSCVYYYDKYVAVLSALIISSVWHLDITTRVKMLLCSVTYYYF